MALTACPECNRQVSSRAPSCPGCGYPVAGHTSVVRRDPDRSARLMPRWPFRLALWVAVLGGATHLATGWIAAAVDQVALSSVSPYRGSLRPLGRWERGAARAGSPGRVQAVELFEVGQTGAVVAFVHEQDDEAFAVLVGRGRPGVLTFEGRNELGRFHCLGSVLAIHEGDGVVVLLGGVDTFRPDFATLERAIGSVRRRYPIDIDR